MRVKSLLIALGLEVCLVFEKRLLNTVAYIISLPVTDILHDMRELTRPETCSRQRNIEQICHILLQVII